MRVVNSVREKRKQQQLTQEDLASICSVSRQTILALEKSAHVPTLTLALKLGKALGCHLEELFGLEDA